MEQATRNSTANLVSNKYLTFKLASEKYAIEILKVREIIEMIPITRLPQTPIFIRGVINLRGNVIAVIDLRRKFGIEENKDTQETCMIVIDLGSRQIAVIVDAVYEVLDIAKENIEDIPSFGTKIDMAFIQGIGKVGEEVVILLDIEKVLTSEELVLIESLKK